MGFLGIYIYRYNLEFIWNLYGRLMRYTQGFNINNRFHESPDKDYIDYLFDMKYPVYIYIYIHQQYSTIENLTVINFKSMRYSMGWHIS